MSHLLHDLNRRMISRRELFQAIAVAGIPGGVPVIWHGAAMVKAEMDELGLKIDERYGGPENSAT